MTKTTTPPRHKLLTKKQAFAAAHTKGATLRGTPLNYSAADEVRYRNELLALIVQMTSQTEYQIEKLFRAEHAKEYFGMDDTIASQARIILNAVEKKFQQLFSAKAQALATDMVTRADRSSSSSLYTSLKQLSGGLSLKTSTITQPMKEVMKASIAENVSLIRSIPSQYHTQVQGAVLRSITSGNGQKDLVPAMEKYNGITKRRARLIAKDQTRKVYNNLNAGRMTAIGLDTYEWLHSAGDLHPRELHLALNGQICSLSKPPVIDPDGTVGKPGDLVNCTCKMVPCVKFTNEDGEE